MSLVAAVILSASAFSAELPTKEELINNLKKAESPPISLTGREVDVVTRVGVPEPDVTSVSDHALDGEYRWYIDRARWWSVKSIPVPGGNGKWPGLARAIRCNYGDQVLSATDFEETNGRHHFLSAHLNKGVDLSNIGPMLGRRWDMGTFSGLLGQLKEVRLSRDGEDIRVDGNQLGGSVRFVVSPGHGYLVTSYLRQIGSSRAGFDLMKVHQVDGVYFPEEAKRFCGDYSGSSLAKGFEASISYSDFKKSGPPAASDVPPIPQGALISSDALRLYRMGADGKLVDFGRMGTEPRSQLSYGTVLVWAGLGLTLTGLVLARRSRRAKGPSF